MLAALPVAAEPKRLAPDEAYRLAWSALHGGDAQSALSLADALAQRTPDSPQIALLRSSALHALGRRGEALRAGRHAWSQAESDGDRFKAAQHVAKLHFEAGAKSRAQFWLRRAEEHAPTREARALAVRNFRFVRATNPLTLHANFAVFPTSNINNGSTTNIIMINGLPFQVPTSGQPHSGIGTTAGLSAIYRVKPSERRVLRFGISGAGTTYRLSSAARALGSGKRGSDFAYAALDLTAGVTFLPDRQERGWGATDVELRLGRSWYGGDPLANTATLSVGQDVAVSGRDLLRFTLGAERQARLDDDRASATAVSGGADWFRMLQNGARLGFGLSFVDTSSASNIVDSRSAGASLSLRLPDGPWEMRTTFSLGVRQTDYDGLVVGGVARRDTRLSAGVQVMFPRISYYGFAPTLSVSTAKTDSTLSIYSTRDLRMHIGVKSTF